LFSRIINKREEHQKNVQIHTILKTVQTRTIRKRFAKRDQNII
jgi:hypothetical protein